MEQGLKIGSCLLAIALFGALTMQIGLGRQASAGPHNDGKAVHHSTGTPHRRTNVVSQPANPVVRNAIGVQVVRPEGLERREDRGSFAAARASLPATDGATGGASSATHIDAVGWRPPSLPHPNLVVRSAAMNRGSIGGTWLAHRGPIPASLGGPNSAFGGISGTMIRPKH